MKPLLIVFFFISAINIHAQDIIRYRGARSAGMATATASLKDTYSIFNNIAGIASVENWSGLGGYQNRYALAAFQTLATGFVMPHKDFSVGIGVIRFGDPVFNQHHLRAAIGNKIQKISLGLAMDYHQYALETIGVARSWSLTFGGIAEITPNLSFGLHATNLTQTKLNTEPDTPLPTVLTAGLSYLPTGELILIAEIEKELNFEELLKIGIEYELINRVFLRTGILPTRKNASFGLGFRPSQWTFDYAFTTDPGIGSIHDFSFLYQFQP